MTPTDCLKAGPAELAPIVAEMMGKGWRAAQCPEACRVVHTETTAYLELSSLADAFRIQSRVAELGLQREFAECLSVVSGANESWEDGLYGFCLATASPLDRTRAACAAYLESKEPARG